MNSLCVLRQVFIKKIKIISEVEIAGTVMRGRCILQATVQFSAFQVRERIVKHLCSPRNISGPTINFIIAVKWPNLQ